ncbi:MAG: hypothetical protein ABI904_19255 [Chloroflexota bacterium]
MKKLIPFLLLGLILSSCAGGFPDLTSLIATATPPPPVDTPTPQPTVTLIPTIDLFTVPTSTPVTFTPTATSLIPVELLPSSTAIPLPTFSEQFINDQSTTTFFVQNVGFKGVLYSDAVLYWNEGPCVTRKIKITAFVEDPARTDRVFLFLRLRDKNNTLKVGEWSAGAQMIKVDDGSFNYNIETRNLRRYAYYKQAWIEYELVAVNENLEILGRTQLYDHNISLVKCGFVGTP